MRWLQVLATFLLVSVPRSKFLLSANCLLATTAATIAATKAATATATATTAAAHPLPAEVPQIVTKMTVLCSRRSSLVPLRCRIHQLQINSPQCKLLMTTAKNACSRRNHDTPFELSYSISSNYQRNNTAITTIPKHLHQTWKSRSVPSVFQRYYDSWSKNHPSWTRQVWSDDDNRQLIQTEFPELLHFYDNLSHTILRVDIIRYLYMYQYGGIYADLDMESLKPMDSLFTNTTHVLLGFEVYEPNFIIEISLMGSIPKHSLWLKVVYESILSDADTNVHSIFEITGNKLFTRVVRKELLQKNQNHGIQVLNQEFLYPPYPLRYLTRKDQRCRCGPVAPFIGYPCHACNKMYPNSYSIHHETGTWLHSWNKICPFSDYTCIGIDSQKEEAQSNNDNKK